MALEIAAALLKFVGVALMVFVGFSAFVVAVRLFRGAGRG